MKFVSYFRMLLILIVIFSVSTVAADEKEFKLIERFKSQDKHTYFNNKQLTDEILIKYLQELVPKHFNGSRFIGLWGVYRDGRKATVYFFCKKGSSFTKSFELVRLDSGYWFNITRGRYVALKK